MKREPKIEDNKCCSRGSREDSLARQNGAAGAEIEGLKRTRLRIPDMCCGEEVAAIERAFKGKPGVAKLEPNLTRGTLTVSHDERVSPQSLIDTVRRSGLRASLEGSGASVHEASSARRFRIAAVSISGVLAAFGLVAGWWDLAPAWLVTILFACSIVAGGTLILPKAVRALRSLSLDMNVLMTAAVLGAAAIGEWGEAATVVFLFSFSELLESLSLGRARRAIESLMQLAPDTALVKRGDDFVRVPVEEVSIGEIVAVKSGSRVPLDGEVAHGSSSVNQAPVTGESMPVEKVVGDEVFAGSINGEGAIDVRVSKLSTDSTLARIIQLVEEAQSQKAPSERFVDVFARYYTPSVFALALLIAIAPPLLLGEPWMVWVYRALVLLVIACPCALVISTPVSIVSGLTAMARRGVLVKGGVVLETVGRLRALATDKTGTVTEGLPRVMTVIPMECDSEQTLLDIAASIDVHSEHPVARAVVNRARELGASIQRSTNYRARGGRGAEGEIDGRRYFVGNLRFAQESGVSSQVLERSLAEIEGRGESAVVVGKPGESNAGGVVLGVLGVGDAIRPGARQAFEALHREGVRKVVILSGDNQRTVDTIARQAGIDLAEGGLLPEDKVERLRALAAEHKVVGMVGDGVNDAPAMAIANVGIAMGAAGTDTALETADMALMEDDLSKLALAVHMGRRTLRIIRANIAFALIIKAVFLILAVTGYASLWLAILADTGATLVVIANGLRLLGPSISGKFK